MRGLSIHEVARRYEVALETHPVSRGVRRCQGAPPTGWTSLSFASGSVWYAEQASRAEILHEVMHLVLTPPQAATGVDELISLERLPEDFVLLQVERAVARTMGDVTYAKVVQWQEETAVWMPDEVVGRPAWDRDLGQIPDYEDTDGWRRGLRVGQEIGVLDDEHRPTWRCPVWTALALREYRSAMESMVC